MSTFIHHELLLFIRTVAVGAVLLLCYDLLRALRDVFAHSRKITEAEDLIYWLCCTVFVFTEIYRANDGILRFFMILGILLGAWICHVTISTFFVKCCTRIMEIPVIVLEFLIKWLLFPVRRCKLFVYKYVKKERLANWGILRKKRRKK